VNRPFGCRRRRSVISLGMRVSLLQVLSRVHGAHVRPVGRGAGVAQV